MLAQSLVQISDIAERRGSAAVAHLIDLVASRLVRCLNSTTHSTQLGRTSHELRQALLNAPERDIISLLTFRLYLVVVVVSSR